jgi:hypothetical protein
MGTRVIRRMVWRILRVAGWLMTPIVILAAAGAGAFLLALVAPRFSVTLGLVVVAVAGLLGGIAGFSLWVRVLSRSPELRQALAVTSGGVPEAKAVEELFQSGGSAPGDGSS